jgi:hypothetical protein
MFTWNALQVIAQKPIAVLVRAVELIGRISTVRYAVAFIFVLYALATLANKRLIIRFTFAIFLVRTIQTVQVFILEKNKKRN